MARTPRLDAIEAHLADHDEKLAYLEDVVTELVPEPPAPVDPVDIPDPDGITPRQRWIKGCGEVVEGARANGEMITMNEANARLINLLQNMQKPAGEI